MSAIGKPMWRWKAGNGSGVCRCGARETAQRHAEPYITGTATGLVEQIVLEIDRSTAPEHLPTGAAYTGRCVARGRVVWTAVEPEQTAKAS